MVQKDTLRNGLAGPVWCDFAYNFSEALVVIKGNTIMLDGLDLLE